MVGAGVTGLSAAFLLRRSGADVVLFEASDRAGGVVRTQERDGFVLECGPESIRGGPAPVARLLDALRLTDRVVTASDASKARLLLYRGRPVALPSSPLKLASIPRLGRRGAMRLLLEPLIRARPRPGETVYDFAARRIGRRAAAALLDPVIAGIYAGDPRQLEAESALSRFVVWEREHGGLVRGAMATRGDSVPPKGSFTFRGGMERLIDTLVAAVGPDLHLNDPVVEIERVGAGFRVITAAGAITEVDRVVVTCDPKAARAMLPAVDVPDSPRAPVVAVHLGFAPEDVPGGLPGFGWLAHSAERRDVLGCLWVSGTFPGHAPPGHHLLRVMSGGMRDPRRVDLPDDQQISHARSVLREVQGIRAEPVVAHVARAVPGIPQYPPGFAARLARLRQLPGLDFAGWFYGGIGVADGISAAEALVSRG